MKLVVPSLLELSGNIRRSVVYAFTSSALLSLSGCAATPDDNDAWLMPTTGQYQAQDTDTEQNGQQSFEGQLNYMQEQKQDKQQQQQQSNQIQDQMSQEYQQQIQQQKNAQ